MKKIINEPSNVVDEMLDGFVYANGDRVKRIEDTTVIAQKDIQLNKVALVSGGGSGHEPAHAGFVGQGMLQAAVSGEVFTSPTPDQVFEGIKAADAGAGVFLIIKNYTGDVMNFDMAKELAEAEGINVDYVIVDDDIAVEDSTHTAGKRGVAGTVFVHKILGAAADRGYSLHDLKQLADRLVLNVKSVGVAMTAATVPEVGKPGFTLADDEMEYGVGIHSEPGYKRTAIKSAEEIAAELTAQLKKAFDFQTGQEYALLINGLGATPLMEQYILANDVNKQLSNEAIAIPYKKVGNWMTSLDMNGVSLTMLKLEDDWVELLNHPVSVTDW
ncbi:dihydroxyacetone kinase subunit DhaK [Salisediminibacterium halotolerans]|uniref:Dihydroxyacetone kinase, N-terminal domain n=1 Tax=Salisediminibacterium halotolerans TaxID=517425 RepID=A0A1H9UHP3_9BACI|nr:dihydroxyacetone kinase subunit DhaK [Salisediminibacterium haloalkalitolerans]SES08583.1 dihydroxyacetone kinase, N-terminal domain [Salisediminibacterium haloalkalitolerans]